MGRIRLRRFDCNILSCSELMKSCKEVCNTAFGGSNPPRAFYSGRGDISLMPRVLSIGQCGFDHGTLRYLLRSLFGTEPVAIDSADAAFETIRKERFDLVMVNRIFDSDGGSGLEFVRAMKADPDLAAIPVMLVSDLEEAQKSAVALGAEPGFGKRELATRKARERLEAVLGEAHPS
jgi:two-component system chemotaxis response regulator CheY